MTTAKSQVSHGPPDPAREPSPWIVKHAGLVAEAGRDKGRILDVACGGGRNARHFLALGHRVTMVDINVTGVKDLEPLAEAEIVRADLEGGPWPFAGRQFAAVVVTNYLWRPLFPSLLSAVAPGGLLLYETFAAGHDAFGAPKNPHYLLEDDELLDLVKPAFEVIDYEAGFFHEWRPAILQRICARRPLTPRGP